MTDRARALETLNARKGLRPGTISTLEFSMILIEAAEEQGRADLWLLDNNGDPVSVIGHLGIPGGGQDLSGANLLRDPVWKGLIDRLAVLAGGRIKIETCSGSAWIQQGF
jgi:hypothetical protein